MQHTRAMPGCGRIRTRGYQHPTKDRGGFNQGGQRTRIAGAKKFPRKNLLCGMWEDVSFYLDGAEIVVVTYLDNMAVISRYRRDGVLAEVIFEHYE